MKLFIGVTQVFVCDMRVDLCGGDVAMAKHTLHTSDIGAVHEQVCCVAVSHGVRADVLSNASQSCVGADHPLNTTCRQSSIVASGTCCVVAAIA